MKMPLQGTKCLLVLFAILVNLYAGFSQTGSLTATFTSADKGIKPVNISLTKPLFKFDDPNGYWFVNPHNGQRHFNTSPEHFKAIGSGAANITFNEDVNDFDIYQGTSNDSDAITLQRESFIVTAPEYDPKLGDKNKPLHIHIHSFSNAEIDFAISGTAELESNNGNGQKLGFGTIEGKGHFYREPKFVKSDVLPGCDCDPTIYAATFDPDNNIRTKSACEAALRNKLFDAVQRAMTPLFSKVAYQAGGTMSAGDISITMLPGTADITVPVKERPWCSSDYYHNGLTGAEAHKKAFTNDDGFGLRFIKAPSNEVLNPGGEYATLARQRAAAKMDSITKLAMAKKISNEQYNNLLQAAMKEMSGASGNIDLKKEEALYNLYLKVIINVSDKETALVKVGDKSKTVVQHNVKGSAFEVWSPLTKDGDGSWIWDRMSIYFGKFTPPVMGKSGGGFDAETTTAVYPPAGNKLTVYNIIVKMEGSKEMMDKALAAIDFAALQSLIAKQ